MHRRVPVSIEVGLSIGALIVAIGSAFGTWRTAKHSNTIQERLLRLESARERDRIAGQLSAAVFARLDLHGDSFMKLRVRNDGPGAAASVAVFLDGVPLAQSPRAHARHASPFPLGPNAEQSFTIPRYLGARSTFLVRLEWIDGTSDARAWESQLGH